MTDEQKTKPLARLLSKKIGGQHLVCPEVTTPGDYEAPFRGAKRKALMFQEQVERN
jgi:hypothetical protein